MPDEPVRVVVALGVNLGDRASTLRRAVEMLQATVLSDAVASPIYRTEPVGFTDQPEFLNMAVAGTTLLDPFTVSETCRRIEHALGRQPRAKWHEREIDLDVILFGDRVIDTPDLQVPHPRMHERRFVLRPSEAACHGTGVVGPLSGYVTRRTDVTPIPCASPTISSSRYASSRTSST
jgi:2-amino-4-hydroxy-6-hydroxymethyldihydropteridine diphosphokinase